MPNRDIYRAHSGASIFINLLNPKIMGLTKQLLDSMQTWEEFDHATEMYFNEQEQLINNFKSQSDDQS